MSFKGFTQEMFDFFFAIGLNNNRAFFEANKDAFLAHVKAPMTELCNALSPLMLQIDPQFDTRPERAVSRIYRDARRVKDGRFYRDHMWIAFKHTGQSVSEAFAFWLEAGAFSFEYGLGMYTVSKPAMDSLRRRACAEPEAFERVIELTAKAGYSLKGEDYRRLDIPQLNPEAAEVYRKKYFYLVKSEPIGPVHCSPQLPERMNEEFSALIPIYDFVTGRDIRWTL